MLAQPRSDCLCTTVSLCLHAVLISDAVYHLSTICVAAIVGQGQADSPSSARSPPQSPLPFKPQSVSKVAGSADAADNNVDSLPDEQEPGTSSKLNLDPVLKSSRGPAPPKVGSPRSPTQPASPIDRKTRAGRHLGSIAKHVKTATILPALRQPVSILSPRHCS